jgi:hypothetical protein
MQHPGSVHREQARQRCSDEFRYFIVALRLTHATVDLEAFAAAVQVPLGTLKDWLRMPPDVGVRAR